MIIGVIYDLVVPGVHYGLAAEPGVSGAPPPSLPPRAQAVGAEPAAVHDEDALPLPIREEHRFWTWKLNQLCRN